MALRRYGATERDGARRSKRQMDNKVRVVSGPIFGIGTAIFICWLLFWDFGTGPDLYDAIRFALLNAGSPTD